MATKSAPDSSKRLVPSVDEVIRASAGTALVNELGRDAALRMVRVAIENVRQNSKGAATKDEALIKVEDELSTLAAKTRARKLKKVINATGVIIHTNLGRSPLSAEAVKAMVEASGYCNVELDLESGERGRRGASAEKLLAELTGAEDGLIVNNCAAAALLVLSAIAKGGEVIVSRGELVEIGGDFRVPDVLVESGCALKEVGTTNRTKLADYERAINENTKAILRVHPSNYRITGFTESPSISDLADLALRNKLILIEDAGSGALIDLSSFGLSDEPVIRTSIENGSDIVVFSGDKLAGTVQAGLIVGKKDLVQRCRKSPLYRALRAGKLVYAAVEAALESFARELALDEIPTLRMLSMSFEEVDGRAKELVRKLANDSMTVSLIRGSSAIGGGAGTGIELATSLIALKHSKLSPNELAACLRAGETPIVARISDDQLLIDLRTVLEADENTIVDAIKSLSRP